MTMHLCTSEYVQLTNTITVLLMPTVQILLQFTLSSWKLILFFWSHSSETGLEEMNYTACDSLLMPHQGSAGDKKAWLKGWGQLLVFCRLPSLKSQ